MARKPGPWFWKKRNAWYLQLKGKHIRLGKTRKEADLEWHRIMSAEGLLDDKQLQRLTVAEACEAMIANSQHLRPNTIRHYVEKLGAFAKAFGSRRLDSIGHQEVFDWVTRYESPMPGRTIGESTRSLMFRFVKQLYKWCRDTGRLPVDPFARAPNKWHVRKRNKPMSEADYEKILSSRASPAFKEVVEFIWCTGIRPGELCVLAARHMDSREAMARFQPAEHKTGGMTGLQREVYFPAYLWERLKGYADIHKKGPLLRRANGKPWTRKLISDIYGKLKRTHKLESVLYQARHRWATYMLDSGKPTGRVAKMLGHNSTDVLVSTYYHPEAAQMAADVDEAASHEQERMLQISAKVAAARAETAEHSRQKKKIYDAERRRQQRALKRDSSSSDT